MSMTIPVPIVALHLLLASPTLMLAYQREIIKAGICQNIDAIPFKSSLCHDNLNIGALSGRAASDDAKSL